MSKQVTEDLNNQFLEDLKSAIETAYDENTPSFFAAPRTLVCLIAYQNVLDVIGKYSAVPNEPKYDTITNG